MTKHLLIGGVLAISLAACAPVFEEGEPKSAMDKEPLVIGVLLPLSGDEAAYGIPAQHVLEIAAGDINDAGGIGGRKIELAHEDGACSAERSNTAASRLVDVKKVKVIVGGFCSSETLGAAPVVEQKKVVLISPASSSPKITTAGDFVFRNYPSDKGQGDILSEYAISKGFKKVGILTEEQPYTEGIADAFKAAFTGETVIEKFTKDAADFKTQIDLLREKQVDLFFVNSQAPAKGAIIVKQLQEKNVQGPFLLNDVVIGATNEVVKPFAQFLEGSVGAEVPYNKDHPALSTLQKDYLARTNGEIPYLAYMSPTYDVLFIIKEAVEKVGDDPVAIKEYLYTVKGRLGLAGTLSIDENGDPDKSYRHKLRKVLGGVVVDG